MSEVVEAVHITRQEMVKMLSDAHMEGYVQGVDHGITIIERAYGIDLSEAKKMAADVAKEEKERYEQEEAGSQASSDRADTGSNAGSGA